MKWIKDLTNISTADFEIAGGKAGSLGDLIRVGMHVPEGFVILSSAFDKFIEEAGLERKINTVLKKVDTHDVESIEKASDEIKKQLLSREIPHEIKKEILERFKKLDCKYVAVRSSANVEDSSSAAWAGQLDSYLNTTERTLVENIKKCWVSLFSPRAIFYKLEKNQVEGKKISVAVIVQKMIDSEKSGIGFSIHPVTHNKKQVVIEACFGLGEAIASGSITPDTYIIDKKNFSILEKKTGKQTKALYRKEGGGGEWKKVVDKKKQILSESEINQLAHLILKIENYFKFPCDVEWAIEKNHIYILQARPLTTLHDKKLSIQREFINYVSREMSLNAVYYPLYASCKKVVFDYKNKDHFYFSKKGFAKGYKSKQDYINTLNKIREIVAQGKLKNVLEEFINLIKKREEFVENFTGSDLALKKKEKIIFELEEFHDFYLKYWSYHIFAFNLGKALSNTEYENLIKKHENLIKKVRVNPFLFYEEKYLPHLFKWIEKNYLIKKEFLYYLTPDEIIDFLKNNTLNIEEIKRRKKYYLIEFDLGGNIKLLSGRNALKEYHERIGSAKKSSLSSGKAVKGSTAYPGKVKGRVKVVFLRKDLKQIPENCILVTSQTTPEFVPYLKKVRGIITDEGGITCHAAIISRELKIPCIIGTSSATSVLKDNDLVELDANQGVVRILKRAGV